MFEFDLSGVFGWDITPPYVKDKLSEAKGQDLQINISSVGGDVFDGIDIYNQLRDYKRKNPNAQMIARMTGVVASMAAYTAMGPFFDMVIVEDNAAFMIHNSWTFAIGDKNVLRDAADMLDGLDKPMVKLVASKTGKSESEAQKLLDAESWYFGEQIVEAGFANEVITDESNANARMSIEDANIFIINAQKAASQKLFQKYAGKAAASLNIPQATVGSYDANIKIIDQTWDQSAAEKRWRTHASAEDGPNAKYRQAFMWFDGDNSENFTAYKLQVKDFIDGSEVVNIRAVNNASARLGQTQGPTADEKDRIQSIIDRYQERWRSQQENNAMNEEEVRQEGVNAENERISGIMALKEKYGENLKDSPGVFAKISEIVDKGVVDKKATMQSVLTDINLFLTSGNIQAALESPGSTPQGGSSTASGEQGTDGDEPHGEDW